MSYILKCLIVDDDPMFAMVAESILLTLTSGSVQKASNGAEGLALLASDGPHPDIVFLDLNMPDVDGLAFMRAAKEAGFQGNIVISSGETAVIRRSAEAMGKMLGISVIGSVEKPLRMDTVRTMLDLAANTRRPGSTRTAILLEAGFELTPYYQPQFELRSGRLVGFESLIRLTTKDGLVHGPDHLFSKIGSVDELADVSLTIARKVMEEWRRWSKHPTSPEISINFDASVLERPEVVEALLQATAASAVAPDHICLEMTEKSLPTDISRLVEATTRLRMAGFKLSLDDYGMGSSSFELLRLCPFSEIKVDRSITEASTSDHVTRKFLHAVAGLARDLELVSVAEGVETEDELEQIRSAGLDRVQGFLFSRPVPPSAIGALLETVEKIAS